MPILRTLIFDLWVTQMVQVYREHSPDIEPYPEVHEVLQRLRPRYRLGLITDGYVEVQRRKLTALGLASYFDATVFSDEWGCSAWKPNALPFEIALERLSVSPREVVYVADNPEKDFLCARRVGIWGVRVRRLDGIYSHLMPLSDEYAPDFEIETLDCLEAILLQIRESDDADPHILS